MTDEQEPRRGAPDDIFRSESWKKTYFGLGISHRSGIFASSRLLGSVNGGSNYIYAYLESSF